MHNHLGAHYKKVGRFQRTFNKKAINNPPRTLNASLMREEANEYEEAPNPVEVLDAITDMYYVLLGIMVQHGIKPETLHRAFNEVHRSNMSKLWSLEEVRKWEPQGGLTFIQSPTHLGKFIAYNRDGKIVKPSTYNKPNLAKIYVNPRKA